MRLAPLVGVEPWVLSALVAEIRVMVKCSDTSGIWSSKAVMVRIYTKWGFVLFSYVGLYVVDSVVMGLNIQTILILFKGQRKMMNA